MKIKLFFGLLIISNYIATSWIVLADSTIAPKKSFKEGIHDLENESEQLCSHIQEKSLATIKQFKNLMQDAHIYCPNREELEVSLYNIAVQADTHYTDVTQQLSTCNSILYVLTKSLESGNLADFYLKEGNYSIVTNIIDKWHQTVLNFKSEIHTQNVPLDIILNNKKTFFMTIGYLDYSSP